MTQPCTDADGPADLCAPTRLRTRLLLIVLDPGGEAGPALREALHPMLDVLSYRSVVEGLLAIGGLHPDAVLVAACTPTLDTVELISSLHDCCAIPVLVGIGDTDGAVAGRALAAGAVACVAYPYRPSELEPLLRSISRGPVAVAESVLELGELRLDPDAHLLTLDGRRIDMPLREFQLLHLLMRHAGRVITRDQIEALLWPGEDCGSNTITVHIRRIRVRLGDDPVRPVVIETIRGLGYRFAPSALDRLSPPVIRSCGPSARLPVQ